MGSRSEPRLPVLHIGEYLVWVGRCWCVRVKMILPRTGVIIRIDDQHPVPPGKGHVALHHRKAGPDPAIESPQNLRGRRPDQGASPKHDISAANRLNTSRPVSFFILDTNMTVRRHYFHLILIFSPAISHIFQRKQEMLKVVRSCHI